MTAALILAVAKNGIRIEGSLNARAMGVNSIWKVG